MKSPYPHSSCWDSEQFFKSAPHLCGCLVCEGNSKNTVRGERFLLDQPGDSMNQDTSLPTARTGKN